jgi:hypothetical protein
MKQRPERSRWKWLFLAALLPLATPAAAQVSTSAVVRGEVRDSAGLAIADARVEVRDADGRVLGGTETDGHGRFVLLGLPSGGPYQLAAEHPGAGSVVQGGLHLSAGDSRRVVLTLGVRPIELPGLRVATAPDLTFSGTRTGAVTTIEERTIRVLPTIDRDIVGFATLSPLVSIHEGAISVAGQNSRFNSLRIDGAVSQDVFGLSPSGVPGGQANAKPLPMEAIQQYSVLVAPYDVRQAGFTGGLLNATTRSGGERWEGSGFAYYRDAAFSGSVHDSDPLRYTSRGPTADFRTETGGFAVGGPLGGARVFAAAEIERRRRPLPGVHLHETDPQLLRLHPDSVNRMVSVLRNQYGFDAGGAGSYTLENPLDNVFLRLDAPVAAGHELMAHFNWIAAADDVPASRMAFGPYQLTSAATRLDTRTSSVVTRLASRIAASTTNELLLSLQHTRDRPCRPATCPRSRCCWSRSWTGTPSVASSRRAPTPWPTTTPWTRPPCDSPTTSTTPGGHLLTAGLEAAWSSISRTHLPTSRGVWRFYSIAELEADRPYSHERLVLDEGAGRAVEFDLLQVAGYLQDEWAVGDAFTLNLGVRFDLPVPLSRPGYNRAAEVRTGVVTDRVPSGNLLLSPRIGFNFTPGAERLTQIRGGVGFFAAPPPLAWIADTHANTGLRTTFVTCTDSYTGLGARVLNTPGLGTEPPTECLQVPGSVARDLTFFADDFRYPQDLRVSLGADRELPWGVIATVDALYTRALHQVALEDLNLGAMTPGPITPERGFARGVGTRPIFGSPRLIPDRFGALEPEPQWPGYGRVIRIGNRSRNASLSVATELQRRFSDRLDFRLAYTYTRALDTRSLLHQDAVLNYGLTPTRGDPARPEPRLSVFDRPHRVMGTVWSRIAPWGEGLDAALVYVGQSGLPYSYVYETDVNGDGFPGPGAAAEAYNDLLHVPMNSSDLVTDIASMTMLLRLAALEPCLSEARGAIVARNACRAPWSNRLDVRLSQGLGLGNGRVRVTADVLNVLNLLNQDWGLVHIAPPVVPVFRLDQRTACPGVQCSISNDVLGYYTGPRRRDPESGRMVADRPYVLSYPDSHWRAQLGVRFDF